MAEGPTAGATIPQLWLRVLACRREVACSADGALAAVDDYQVDAFTEVDARLRVAGEPLRPGRGGAVTLSTVVRARRFGLRFGLGYGHFAVPRVRLVVPVAIPFFTVDVYARFGGH